MVEYGRVILGLLASLRIATTGMHATLAIGVVSLGRLMCKRARARGRVVTTAVVRDEKVY